MNRFVLILIAFLIGNIVNAQDFSYLKDIDLDNSELIDEADEAAMECCCYLIAVRYDKKDVQRQYASAFIERWATINFPSEQLLDNSIATITEGRKEINDMYMTYYTMTYIDSEKQADKTSLKQEALLGVIDYCSNSGNKLKLTKELKLIKQYSENGNLEEYLQDENLSSL